MLVSRSWLANGLPPALFSLSLFLYPFAPGSHLLYLAPQLALLAVLAWQVPLTHRPTDRSTRILLWSAVGALASALMVEATADHPNGDLVSKMTVNLVSLGVMALARRRLVSERTIVHLNACVVAWTAIALYAYHRANTTIAGLGLVLLSSDAPSSSDLYGLVEPLQDLFLTKNISAMFMVAVLCLYLGLHLLYRRRVSKIWLALMLFAIVMFLSRQAILSAVIALVAYRVLIGVSLRAVVASLSGLGICIGIFLTFFNLGSQNDGANQRLDLYAYFLSHAERFVFTGLGESRLNDTLLDNVGIDNFHMFFMNQIGAYGLVHFTFFTLMCGTVIALALRCRPLLLPICGYYLNVLFQTFGYEYGNLFLFMVVVTEAQRSWDTRHRPALQHPESTETAAAAATAR